MKKIRVIPSLLLAILCGDSCRRKLHKQEAGEDIKKGNKLDKGKADYKRSQSLTKYIKTDSNTIFVLAQYPQ